MLTASCRSSRPLNPQGHSIKQRAADGGQSTDINSSEHWGLARTGTQWGAETPRHRSDANNAGLRAKQKVTSRGVWGRASPTNDERGLFQSRAGWWNTREEMVAGWPSGAGLAVPNRSSPVVVCALWAVDTHWGGLSHCWEASRGPESLVPLFPIEAAHPHTPCLRGLRPLAYPCLPSTPTRGPRDWRWWTASGRRTCRTSFSQRAPMYQCTSVPGSHPPSLSTRAQR
jgi:hypothetical protein